MNKRMILALVLVGMMISGCNVAGFGLWLFGERPTHYVDSTFDMETGLSLEGKTVAVLIYVEDEIKIEYGYIPQTLGRWIREGLEYQDKERTDPAVKNIRVIHPDTVVRYMQSNPEWESTDKRKIARDLKADYLIYVPLTAYTTREPGMLDAYRGTVVGDVEVYGAEDTSEDRDPLFMSDGGMEVSYPESRDKISYNRASERMIQVEMEKQFGTKIAKLFYGREELTLTEDEQFTEPNQPTRERN
ncbi:MAG: hypothetical protein HN909_09490 [Phycisphaerales bacterium]|jgi:hypothetical protein|nr:hypothetical protein [Phycisphaerales bacterium]MBT7171983.1 hypothetical protein [Phycisphaerales bacterium]